MFASWKESYDKYRQHIKRQRHHFMDKGPYSQSYGFSSSHVQMWASDHKEGWAQKNWCFQTVVLEKPLESPLDSKMIKPVNPTWNQLWIFIGRTDVETEAPILWPPDVKSPLIWKDPDAEKDWGQEKERGDRGWDAWMASQPQMTWIWANSGKQWTEELGVLQSMGLQRVRYNLATESLTIP